MNQYLFQEIYVAGGKFAVYRFRFFNHQPSSLSLKISLYINGYVQIMAATAHNNAS